ncbi:MAG: methyltransferase domain-containing protein [Alphaproteobacteria bacterium]|nr:methyltransferase domain-containing protein [Alphaproteobacteria bacterium]MDE2110453.1 methyltransferase domain-containing protein [Alphaproteobacteria bacterium]MDE2493388.1 methyltransferase domain-containing protein [Alphaproteobacteria bacterium]
MPREGSPLEGGPIEEAERQIADGRAADAKELLRGLLEEGRGGLLARFLYARARGLSGDTAGALETARETAMLYPHVAQAALGLGEALLWCELLAPAIAEFQRTLRLEPALDQARFLLGSAWLQAGEPDKALSVFGGLSDETPGLLEKVAQASAMRTQPRSDAGYVRHLFDQFSADYDSRMLSQLSYRAPEILRQLADLVMPQRKDLAVLDLGCGTGLCGAAFEALAGRLDGVDLSPAMILKARARGIYDKLDVADIESALVTAHYDLLLAADTLVYLGNLEPTFLGAARALNADGFFLFTVESKQDDGFELGPKRRWRHSENYLRALADKVGFEVAGLMDCVPRMEANAPVEGFAVALHKP